MEKAQCPEELTSCHFPSKVGGKPVWLNPVCLPTPEETACSVCGFPRTFLLQVYAPLEDTPAAFHRTFFVFVCLNSSCHQQNNSHGLRVFRSQLPRENPFYGADHEDDDEGGSSEDELIRTESGGVSEDSSTSDSITEPLSCTSTTNALVDSSALVSSLNCLSLSSKKSSEQGREPTPLCVVCGSAGPKKCSRCKAVHYCSKHHQTHDWKSGHKLFCSDLASGRCRPLDVTYNPSHTVCLPEFVLVTEEEPPVTAASEVGEERGEEERMKDYYKFVKSGSYHDHSTSSKTGKKRVQSVMERAESGTMSDKFFRAFQRRVAIEPEQVSHTSHKLHLKIKLRGFQINVSGFMADACSL